MWKRLSLSLQTSSLPDFHTSHRNRDDRFPLSPGRRGLRRRPRGRRRARARRAGLERAFVILEAGNAGEAAQARTLETLWPEVRVAVGVHPHHAQQYADEPGAGGDGRPGRRWPRRRRRGPSARSGSTITTTTRRPPCSGRSFAPRCSWRAKLGQPVVVHTREADEDTIAILTEEGGGEVRGVLHCFTGDTGAGAGGARPGFYISAAGIVTFPKSSELRNTLRHVPLDRLLTETDSPFLAPVPHRGRRNEPAHVVARRGDTRRTARHSGV